MAADKLKEMFPNKSFKEIQNVLDLTFNELEQATILLLEAEVPNKRKSKDDLEHPKKKIATAPPFSTINLSS